MPHNQGLIRQVGPVPLLHRGIKGVAVNMRDGEAVKLRVANQTGATTIGTGPGFRRNQRAAIAAEGWRHER
jgi:hypothetical protein